MARDLEHLQLPQVQGSLPRRLQGGGSSVTRSSNKAHGGRLGAEVDEIVEAASETDLPGNLDPELIFKVELHADGSLDDELLGRMGLQVLAREPGKTLVVFASDVELESFRARLGEYASEGGHTYGEFGGIEHLLPVTPEDRIGRRLQEEPIDGEEGQIPLDVELWHPGSTEDAQQRLKDLGEAVASLDGSISDSIVTPDILLARVQLDATQLDDLLTIDRIREVDRIPDSGIVPTPVESYSIEDFPEIEEPEEGAIGVLVVDSGITPNHPLLAPLVGEAVAFPGNSGPQYTELDTESRMGGHGTAVCGRAGLGDLELIISGADAGGVRLFSARVLDDQCEYHPDELVEHQLEAAVEYFLDNYPECRVVNLSLADDRVVFDDSFRQFRLAARIDELAYELSARNILFVVCTGNFLNLPSSLRSGASEYGKHLDGPEARLIEPATAALALTVGGLSSGRSPASKSRQSVAEQDGYPSPFTRRGPGLDGAVKPDVVEFAGDMVLDASARLVDDSSVGVLSTNRGFAPPEGQIVRRVAGTSFAAPAISNLAARLFERFEDATPNLIRSLIADSARLPEMRPDVLSGKPWQEKVWRVYGHGHPDFERAANSDENDVLLVAESTIDLDGYQLFELPEIPPEFFERSGERYISVTLAYDPPTRQSRADSYLGVALGFRLFRNIQIPEVEQLFRDWEKAPAGPTEDELEKRMASLKGRHKVDLKPGYTLRGKGTLQKGLCQVSNRSWAYNEGEPLVLAVTSQRRWAPASVVDQRFAVVVSLKHSDPKVKLHSRLRERQQERIRARARVQTG